MRMTLKAGRFAQDDTINSLSPARSAVLSEAQSAESKGQDDMSFDRLRMTLKAARFAHDDTAGVILRQARDDTRERPRARA